ncbi:MAG: tetratricopeptide repeat protein [Magnetococcus sp. DMHC-6]
MSKNHSQVSDIHSSATREPAQSLSPTSQEINALITLFNQGHYLESETLALAMTKRFPEYGFAWKVLGGVIKQQGRNADALPYMQKSVKLLPGDAEAHCNLAIVLQELDHLEAAEAMCRRTLELKPDFASAYNILGIIYQKMNRWEESEVSYRQALAIGADFVDAHVNLGLMQHERGDLSAAEASFRRALTLHPGSAAAYNNLGNTLKAQGGLLSAKECYLQALQINSNFADAHLNLGIIYKEQGNYLEAEACYARALALKPNFIKAHINFGIMYKELDRLSQAEASFRRALAVDPNWADLHINLALTLKELDRFSEAEVSYRRVLELDPNHVDAHNNLGSLFREQGRLAEAEACLRSSLEIAPKQSTTYINLGFVLSMLGQLEAAEENCRQALTLLQGQLEHQERSMNLPLRFSINSDAARKTLFDVRSKLMAAKIPFFLCNGTLLGIVRMGELLPNDKDVDIGLPWEVDRDRVLELLCQDGTFYFYNSEWQTKENRQFYISLRHRTRMIIDLFFHRPDGQHFVAGFNHRPQPVTSRPRRFAIDFLHWQGVSWPVPSPSEDYLIDYYGENWRIPDPYFDTILSSRCQTPESRISRYFFGFLRLFKAMQSREFDKAIGYCQQMLWLKQDDFMDDLRLWLQKKKENQAISEYDTLRATN